MTIKRETPHFKENADPYKHNAYVFTFKQTCSIHFLLE